MQPVVDSDGVIYTNTNISNVSLGTVAKTVDTTSVHRRQMRYRLRARAARLLPNERVRKCMCSCGSGGVSLQYSPSLQNAIYKGVTTCGSVWLCPVCSAKISNRRRDELNELLRWARSHDFTPLLLTLTFSHSRTDKLRDNLNLLKAAKKTFHQSRTWRAIAPYVVGHVTATEATFGEHGWHPHFHIIIVFDRSLSHRHAMSMLESARSVWSDALALHGLSCNAHGYHVQSAKCAASYISKWGAAEEVSLSGSKRGKAGRSPWQLLEDADNGDDRAAARFIEYANVFKGRRQLVWSRGLKERAGVVEVEDAEIAEQPDKPADDYEEIISIPLRRWRMVVQQNQQAQLLHAAEIGGYAYCELMLMAIERIALGIDSVTAWRMALEAKDNPIT